MFDEQSAHDLAVFADQHLDNRRLATAAAIDTDSADHDAVAVKYLLHLFRAKKQIVRPIIGNQEAKAIGMSLHPPGNQIELFHQADIAMAIFHDLCFTLHGAEAPLKALHLGIFNMQIRRELGGIHWHTDALQRFKNHFPAGNWILIFGLLPRMMGVCPTDSGGDRFGRCVVFFVLRQDGFRHKVEVIFSGWTVEAEFAMIRPHFTRSTDLQGGFCNHRPDGGIGRRTRFRS